MEYSTIRLNATYRGKKWGRLNSGTKCIIFPHLNSMCRIVVGNRNLKSREYQTKEEFLLEFDDLSPYQDCPNAKVFLERFNEMVFLPKSEIKKKLEEFGESLRMKAI